MPELLRALFSEDINIYLQSIGNPFIDFLFGAITDSGSVQFLFFLGVLIHWCFNKQTGIRVMFMILFSSYAAVFAKNIFGMPRPPEYLYKIRVSELGFPSGHALVSSAFWGYIGCKMNNLAIIFLGTAAILLISLSRVYLGVHFVGDVIGGIFFGLLFALIFFRVEQGIIDIVQRMNSIKKYLAAVTVPAILVLVAFTQPHLQEVQAGLGLVMLGTGIGYHMQEQNIRFGETTNNRQRTKRALTGIILLVVVHSIWITLSFIDHNLIQIKYAALGFTSTYIVPWVFARMD